MNSVISYQVNTCINMSVCLNLSIVLKMALLIFIAALYCVFSIHRMSKLMLHCRKYNDMVVLFNSIIIVDNPNYRPKELQGQVTCYSRFDLCVGVYSVQLLYEGYYTMVLMVLV